MNKNGPANPWQAVIKPAALRVHKWLVPESAKVGFMPYLWVPFLAFLFIEWLFRPVGIAEAIGTFAAIIVFLAVYFRSYRMRSREHPWLVGAMALIGLTLAPFNIGAEVFFIYAASCCGYSSSPNKVKLSLLGGVVVAAVAELLLLGRPMGEWAWVVIVVPVVGVVNIYVGEMARKNRVIDRSQEEIRRLATTAERERIARDLHDLLGHTLTLITVKAELAGTLAERDLPRAGEEIRELEQIARDALAQVRQAVGGYRGDLAGEIANAGVTLRAAGIHFDADAAGGSRGTAQDAALAMVVREAVTNIVRHAGAQTCRLSLRHADARIRLELRDDGHRGRRGEGNGIRGMRERIEALGGTLSVEFGAAGTHLEAIVPAETGRTLTSGPSPEGRGQQEAEVAS